LQRIWGRMMKLTQKTFDVSIERIIGGHKIGFRLGWNEDEIWLEIELLFWTVDGYFIFNKRSPK
jgi:hypothetical protein